MPQDYYTLLGIPHNGSDKEIRTAYRRLARKYHPDVNPNNPGAEKSFKEINEAHEVLSDPQKRRLYDRYGHNWRQMQQFGEAGARPGTRTGPSEWRIENLDPNDLGGLFDNRGLGDIMGRFFGGRRGAAPGARVQQTTLEQPVELSLEEAYRGATRTIQVMGDHLPRPIRAELTIPPGVEDGARIRVTPRGQEVVVVVSVRPHPRFQRKGSDLYAEVPASLYEALLGGEVMVPTITGQVALTLPRETQNGRTFRLAGQGMPRTGGTTGKGSLYATVKVTLPTNLTQEEEDLLHRLQELQTREKHLPTEGAAEPERPLSES